MYLWEENSFTWEQLGLRILAPLLIVSGPNVAPVEISVSAHLKNRMFFLVLGGQSKNRSGYFEREDISYRDLIPIEISHQGGCWTPSPGSAWRQCSEQDDDDDDDDDDAYDC